jgi:hypothetical protein
VTAQTAFASGQLERRIGVDWLSGKSRKCDYYGNNPEYQNFDI